MPPIILLLCAAVLLLLCRCEAEGEDTPPAARPLTELLVEARDGDTVTLPAGSYSGGGILPPGVSLRGAGIEDTFIECAGAEVGLSIDGGSGVTLSDFTIRGARRCNIAVTGARQISVARVRSAGALTGVVFTDVQHGRLENVVSAHNHYGIVVDGGQGNVVVNCTLAENANLALSLPGGAGTIVFNNCLTGSPTAVYLGKALRGLQMDYNLYSADYLGKQEGEVLRSSVADWHYLSGTDAHSVQLPVTYADAEALDYRPTSPSGWSQLRLTTSDWGVATFAQVHAPGADILGNTRKEQYAVGAYEVTLTPTRPADGSFTITADRGVKSAGIFTPDGVLISYLFQNAPLRKGRYACWFPNRDFQQRPIPAGGYEVRVVESDFTWDYLGQTPQAISGIWEFASFRDIQAPIVTFDHAGRVLVGNSWSDDYTNLRAYDGLTGKVLWSLPGGDYVRGLTVGEDGTAYLLRWPVWTDIGTPSEMGLRHLELLRVDAASGAVLEWRAQLPSPVTLDLIDPVEGLAQLHGRLFITELDKTVYNDRTVVSPDAKAIYSAGVDSLHFTSALTVAKPSHPAADAKTGIIWCISDETQLVAFDETGERLAVVTPVEEPVALAARAGMLAVASRNTGKVHFFDAANPLALRELGTLGRGDGPYGAILPDRFLFQRGRDWPGARVTLALGPEGQLAVAEMNRLLVFNRESQLCWSDYSLFGDRQCPAWPGHDRRWSRDGRMTAVRNPHSGQWALDTFYDTPGIGPSRSFFGSFTEHGQVFGVFAEIYVPRQPLKDDNKQIFGFYTTTVVRYGQATAIPVFQITFDEQLGCFVTRTGNGADGLLDPRVESVPITDAEGKRIDANLLRFKDFFDITRFGVNSDSKLMPNGNLATQFNLGWVWPCRTDANGIPTYRYAEQQTIPAEPIISPYSGQANSVVRTSLPTIDSSGGFIINGSLPESDGGDMQTGTMQHEAGTSLLGFDAKGHLRWCNPSFLRNSSDPLKTPLEQILWIQSEGDFVVTERFRGSEIILFTADGLGLGGFGRPSVARTGHDAWLDHNRHGMAIYHGKDDHLYVLRTTFWVDKDSPESYVNRSIVHCYRLDGPDAFVKTVIPVTFTPEAAQATQSGTALPARGVPRPTLRIPRLAQPLPIDGDPAKWRRLPLYTLAYDSTGAQPLPPTPSPRGKGEQAGGEREAVRNSQQNVPPLPSRGGGWGERLPQIIAAPETSRDQLAGPRECAALARLAHCGNNLYVQVLEFTDSIADTSTRAGSTVPCSGTAHLKQKVTLSLNGVREGCIFEVTCANERAIITTTHGKLTLELDQSHAPRVVRRYADAREFPERKVLEDVYGIELTTCPVIMYEWKLPLDVVSFNGALLPDLTVSPAFYLGLAVTNSAVTPQKRVIWPHTLLSFNYPKEYGMPVVWE